MKQSSHIFLLSIFCVTFMSCNDEAFIGKLSIEPENQTLPWTGGNVCFKANQDIDMVSAIVFRWSENRGKPLTDDYGIQYTLGQGASAAIIRNELCDIRLSLDNNNELNLSSGYNLFPDTVYAQFEISSPFETATKGVRILPSPGFGHGKIEYILSNWQYMERTDTVMLAQIGGAADHDADLTLRRKGEIVARRSSQFKPWNKLLSDNIFGRDSFKVEGVRYDPSMWSPELSGEMVVYSSEVKRSDYAPLLYNEDVNITVPANSWAKVRLLIKGEHYGIIYSIPAISPVDDIPDKTIDGVYWLSVPVSYSVETEFGHINKP